MIFWSLMLVGVGLAALAAAVAYRRLQRFSRKRVPHLRATTAEHMAASAPGMLAVLTLEEAVEVAPTYRSRVLVACQKANQSLLERAVLRAADDKTVYVLYVDRIKGIFYPPRPSPSASALETLLEICSHLDNMGVQGVPVWRVAHDPAASIASAARALAVNRVLVDVVEAAPLGQLLSGHTLKRLRKILGDISLEVVRPGVGEKRDNGVRDPEESA